MAAGQAGHGGLLSLDLYEPVQFITPSLFPPDQNLALKGQSQKSRSSASK